MIFLLLTLCPVSAHAMSSGPAGSADWKRHTAFDGQVRKVMEGKRFVYIWAHQQLYSLGNGLGGAYSVPHGTVLYIDKNDLSRGVRGLADDYPTAGMDAGCVAYNSYKGYLVIAYTNGVMDIVTDAGEVRTIRDFDGLDGGMTILPRNIAFDRETGDAWIATNNGFARIDGNGFNVKDYADWGVTVNSICRVGDRVVAVVDNTVYECPVSDDLRNLDNFEPHKNLASKIHGVMPVSDTAFITLTEGKNICLATVSSSGNISLAPQFSDAGFSGQLIGSGPHMTGGVINFNYILNDEFDNNFLPVRDGYMALSKNYLYMLRYNSGSGGMEIEKRKFNTDYVPALARQAGSNDFENFWFYDLRKGFYCQKADGYDDSTVWTDVTGRMQWQGPVGMGYARLRYSPTKGMLCMARSCTVYKMTAIASPIPLLMSGYKNGVWKNYSPVYTTPDFCSTDNEAKKLFESKWRGDSPYPIRHPHNFMVDPLDSDYVMIGSMLSGVALMDLDDITGRIVHFSSPRDDSYKGYPGFVAALPDNSNVYADIYSCGADADRNVWFLWSDPLKSSGKGQGLSMYCWNHVSHEKYLAGQDNGQCEWKEVFFPYGAAVSNSTFMSRGLALKHPSNKNKLILYPKDWSNPIMLVDHKGTLENSSDDRVDVIRHFAVQSGVISAYGYVYDMVEDAVSGDVIIQMYDNLIRFDPDSPVKDNTIAAELININRRDGSSTPVVPNQEAYAVAFDEYNRLWIGTAGDGVYCLSADGKEVMAHYAKSNSPLLSDWIHDVCWNPETQELFIATDGGIMSMNPYTPVGADRTGAPTAEPTMISPEYAGVVRLHNVPAGASIIVEDRNGAKVADLALPVNNGTVWDTCDSEGNLVPSGVYILHDPAGAMDDIQITILR